MPVDYLEWAAQECKENENHIPDLARLAKWAASHQKEGSSRDKFMKTGYRDPEEVAKKAPPVATLPPICPPTEDSYDIQWEGKDEDSASEEDSGNDLADEQKEKIDKLEKTVQDLQEKLNEELAKGYWKELNEEIAAKKVKTEVGSEPCSRGSRLCSHGRRT